MESNNKKDSKYFEKDEFLATISRNAIFVLTFQPEHRGICVEDVSKFLGISREFRDSQTENFLNAVLELLNGANPNDLNPTMPVLQSFYWERIVSSLKMLANMDDLVKKVVFRYCNATSTEDAIKTIEDHRDLILTERARKLVALFAEFYDSSIEGTQKIEKLQVLLDSVGSVRGEGALEQLRKTGSNGSEKIIADIQNILSKWDDPHDLTGLVPIYDEAIKKIDEHKQPLLWATLQVNLATSLLETPNPISSDDISKAINSFTQALKYIDTNTSPEMWAYVHFRLGKLLSTLDSGDPSDIPERIIEHLSHAEEIYTIETNPFEWAVIQHYLGVAFSNRITGDVGQNLDQAFNSIERSLLIFSRESYPYEWAKAISDKAMMYFRNRYRNPEYLQKAIKNFRQAQKVLTRNQYPYECARVLGGLGLAYLYRLKGIRSDNIEKSLDCLLKASTVYSKENHPIEWAEVHNNIGVALSQQEKGYRQENIEKAIVHFQLALQIRTVHKFPQDYRQTQMNLGKLYLELRDWQNAFTALLASLEAGELLFRKSFTERGRKKRIAENTELFELASYCLLQLGKYEDAFFLFDQGKTRNLSEMLSVVLFEKSEIHKNLVEPLWITSKMIARLQGEAYFRNDETLTDDDIREGLQEAQFIKDHILLGASNGYFLPNMLNRENLKFLAPAGGALIVPLITSQGSAIFLIPNGIEKICEKHVLWLDDFDATELQNILIGNIHKPGWLIYYNMFRASNMPLPDWKIVIDNLTQVLWDRFLSKIHQRLKELHIKQVIFVPSGGLQLLPLHAAWRIENNQPKYFCDDYEVSYSPSIQVLNISRQRAAEQVGKNALIAGINTYDELSPLHNAVLEAQIIAAEFTTTPLLESAATKDAIRENAAAVTYLHLACHSSFGWKNNPLDTAIYLFEDEPLTLAEILGQMSLESTRLVTLSACETGITDMKLAPNEYVGLPSGFLQAGASAVVSSLWSVDDASTFLLMQRFYKNHLDSDMPLPTALRNAQNWLKNVTRQEIANLCKSLLVTSQVNKKDLVNTCRKILLGGNPNEKLYEHPYYWAAFIFSGA